jgi:hypothetical protein
MLSHPITNNTALRAISTSTIPATSASNAGHITRAGRGEVARYSTP